MCICKHGFDEIAARCCGCSVGRQRARRMWEGYERERHALREKKRRAEEAREGPALENVGRRVTVSGHSYGFGIAR